MTGAIKPFFYGRASIAGLPADNGVFVDAVIVQGVNDYTVCGQTTVGANMTLFNSSSTGPGAYTLVIDTTKPECLNKKAQYTFFINSVRARAVTNPGFTVNGGTFHVDLDAAEVALVTNGAAGAPGAINKNAPVVYFYGIVQNPRGVVRTGTQVTVKTKDGTCSDVGRTRTLIWEPKAKGYGRIMEQGFYFVTIEGSACENRMGTYVFDVAGQLSRTIQYTTPPYANGFRVDLNAPGAP